MSGEPSAGTNAAQPCAVQRRKVLRAATGLVLAAAALDPANGEGTLAEATRHSPKGRKRRKQNRRKARGKSSLNPVTRLTLSNQVVKTIRAEIWTLRDGFWSLALASLNGSQENRTLDVQAPCDAIACWIERKYFVGLQGLPGDPVATLGTGGAVVNGQWSGGTIFVKQVPLEELQETGMDAGADYLRLIRASVDPNSLRFLLTYQHQ
jgi:hypothetical protein